TIKLFPYTTLFRSYQKNVDYDDKALKVIAKAAEGGMRDALSLLDQVISFGDNNVTLDNALLVTGSVTQESLFNYLKFVLSKDTTNALKEIKQIVEQGKDAKDRKSTRLNSSHVSISYAVF